MARIFLFGAGFDPSNIPFVFDGPSKTLEIAFEGQQASQTR